MSDTTKTQINQISLQKPILIKIVSGLLFLGMTGLTIGVTFFDLFIKNEEILSFLASTDTSDLLIKYFLAGLTVFLSFMISKGLWNNKNWARTVVIICIVIYEMIIFVNILFFLSAEIFAGEEALKLGTILLVLGKYLWGLFLKSIIPLLIIWSLFKMEQYFEETPKQKEFVDQAVRYLLMAVGLSAIFIVFLIIIFTLSESWDAIEEIGINNMLFGTIWRPQQNEYGLIPMVLGSILVTIGSAIIGVPLSIFAAILLSEIAPPLFRNIVRPAIELLAGIPSVIYGLFGMVVLAPIIRQIEIPRNTGFGLLNASIILAVMIIPTITNIAEDAIRAVPKYYKEGSLALGTTHWETIVKVILPSARSGIIAAVILGIGRALGETMAVIMIIGNSIAIPSPITDNPLSIIFSGARTLTGNVAVEINYAAGAHRSALFFTGILLFLMIFLTNSIARFLMKEKVNS